jgi:hypothetical protein
VAPHRFTPLNAVCVPLPFFYQAASSMASLSSSPDAR